MIVQTEHMHSFIDGLENLDKTISLQSSGWLREFRLKNLSRFQKLGFPTTKDEEWKYTNIEPIVRKNYRTPPFAELTDTKSLRDIIGPDEHTFIVVNGSFSPQLSNLKGIPKGIIICALQDAALSHRAEIENILNKYDPEKANKFTALNIAAAGNGAFIKVADKTAVNKLIHIVHVTDHAEAVVMPRTVISLGKSSEASVLETHISFDNKLVYFANALTDIHLAEGSTLQYCKAQSESLHAFHIGTTRVWQERDSNLNGFSFMVGSSITRNNLDVILNAEGASTRVNGLYCVNSTQLVDNHSSVDHRQPNCTSNQLYKGVLNAASRAVFNGKIFVRPIAQKTNSYQLNKNLILGNEARVDTKPQLEISADDVKCTHGATIGQLNEDEIFYLRSRAIAKKTAVKMLCQGFIDDIILTVSGDSVQAKLNKLLEPTLASI